MAKPQQSPEPALISLMQHRFRGINLYVPPQDNLPDELRIADNVYIKGGQARTRPGLSGQLAARMANPIYAPMEYIRPDGTTNVLFTSGGKLYQWVKGAAVALEVFLNGTTSFNLLSAQTQIVRQGKYAYVVDGTQNLTDLVIQSTDTEVSSATHAFQPGDVGKQLTVTSGSGFNYTDLVIGSHPNENTVTSSTRPFESTDVGGMLHVTSGVGFTLQTVTITAVNSGTATLSAVAGTASSTGGDATLSVPGGIAGFTLGVFTIVSVSGGIATLSASLGTANSAGGQGTLAGQLYRIALFSNSSYTAVSTEMLSTPTQPPTVTLTNSVLDLCDAPTRWSSYPTLYAADGTAITSSEVVALIPSACALFPNASEHDTDTPPTGWQTGGDSMDFDNESGYSQARMDSGKGPEWVDWEAPTPSYYPPLTSPTYSYTDLATNGATLDQVTSASRPFLSTDAGGILYIRTGTNFSVGPLAITSVTNGVATVSANAATTSATGGVGTLQVCTNPTTTNARVFVASALSGAETAPGTTAQYDMILIPEDNTTLANSAGQSTSPAPVTFTDLAIGSSSSTSSTLTSAARPFVNSTGSTPGDLGKVITITGGTNFNTGVYTITAVSGNVATVNGDVGTSGASGGSGVLGAEASAANNSPSWGHLNTTLQTPGSAVPGALQDVPFKNVTAGGWQQQSQTFSFTGLSEDFDFIRYRLWGPAVNTGAAAVRSPGLVAVSVGLIVAQSTTNALTVSANNVTGGNCLGGCYLRRDYTAQNSGVDVPALIGDLVIQSTTTQVYSASQYTFSASDIGRFLVITGGTNFTPGRYAITAFGTVGGHATVTLAAPAGTGGATGGQGALLGADAPDYSTNNTLAIAYNGPTSGSGIIPFRLGFLQAGQPASATVWTNAATLISGTTTTYLSMDVSTVPTVVRQQCQYLFLQITSDLPTTTNLSNLFTFGPIAAAGNLSIGFADYSYVFTEVQDSAYDVNGNSTGDTTDGVIESNSGLSSVNITPTGAQAAGQIVLPALTNADANYYYLYRYGGVFPSEDVIPTGRLIAMLPTWTDTLDPATAAWVTWDHTTLTVTDNTPDAAIYTATTLATDRGPAPYGAQTLADWQGRLAVAQGSLLAVSWLVASDQAAALYFNTQNIPNDPYGALKGVQATVGGYDNDPIQALIPFGASLLIFKQRSIWVLVGTDGTNFQISQLFPRAGIGLLAPRAWALLGNTIWFLGPEGIFTFDGTGPAAPISLPIGDLIYPPQVGQPAIPGSTYALGAALYHGQRFYLFMGTGGYNFVDLSIGSTSTWVYSIERPFLPGDVGKTLTISGGTGFTPGSYTIEGVTGGVATLNTSAGTALSTGGQGSLPADSGNTVAYVFDTRQGGWTRFLNMPVTGACSLSSQGDTDDMYVAGSDGQLYLLSYAQQGDIGIAGGSVTAIPFMLRSRGFGREVDGVPWWQQNRPLRALAKLYLNELATVTLQTGAVGSAVEWSIAHAQPMGSVPSYQYYRDAVRRDVRGDAVYVQVSGTTVTPTIISAVGVDLAKGAVRNSE